MSLFFLDSRLTICAEEIAPGALPDPAKTLLQRPVLLPHHLKGVTMCLKTATIASKVTSRVSDRKPIAQIGRAFLSIVTMIFFLTSSLVFPRQGLAQDPLTGAAIISEADSVIGQLNTLGANLGGDFSIATGGTAGQLSALLSQFKGIIGENVTAPLNSLGLDAQNLGRQIHAGVGQLNQILSQQRNCGVANAESLISGLRNVAQGTLLC
jgi:hypothetical protein